MDPTALRDAQEGETHGLSLRRPNRGTSYSADAPPSVGGGREQS